jgi:hypothetical protein
MKIDCLGYGGSTIDVRHVDSLRKLYEVFSKIARIIQRVADHIFCSSSLHLLFLISLTPRCALDSNNEQRCIPVWRCLGSVGSPPPVECTLRRTLCVTRVFCGRDEGEVGMHLTGERSDSTHRQHGARPHKINARSARVRRV